MSELIQKNDNRATIRWKLLTGASALALTAYVSSAGLAAAEDTDHAQVWIELGGQLNRLQDGQETFAPALMDNRPSIFSPSAKFDKPPLYGIDEFASLSFQPEGSDWIFAASIRYGRSTSIKHVHQQTYPGPEIKYYTTGAVLTGDTRYPDGARFADTRARNNERHLILDFQSGKDVGLGMFGIKDGSSTVSLGVRFAQFKSNSNITLKSDPDFHFRYKYFSPYIVNYFHISKIMSGQPFHTNAASFSATRSFHGLGPSISWNASVPFAGNAQDGQLDLDWGLNAALLFGRQKTRTQHSSTARYNTGGTPFASFGVFTPGTRNAPPARTRSRNVTVPNVGGSVGLSWQLQNFKMSFGYKADFFFGAIDGGIDAAKKENRGFYGPYASISIGLGD